MLIVMAFVLCVGCESAEQKAQHQARVDRALELLRQNEEARMATLPPGPAQEQVRRSMLQMEKGILESTDEQLDQLIATYESAAQMQDQMMAAAQVADAQREEVQQQYAQVEVQRQAAMQAAKDLGAGKAVSFPTGPQTGTIKGSRVNVRASADLSAEVLLQVDRGDVLIVHGTQWLGDATWFRVEGPEFPEGWIRGDQFHMFITAENLDNASADYARQKNPDAAPVASEQGIVESFGLARRTEGEDYARWYWEAESQLAAGEEVTLMVPNTVYSQGSGVNVHAEPAAGAESVAVLDDGAMLFERGCRLVDGKVWVRVEGGPQVDMPEGWVPLAGIRLAHGLLGCTYLEARLSATAG